MLFAFSLTSCEKEIEIDLKSAPQRLVIEGVIKDGENALVKITKTKNYDDYNGYPPVTGATVTISDDRGNSDVLTFNSATEAYESSTIKGEQGVTYYLSVDVEDKIYTAESKLPNLIVLDSIYIYKFMTDTYMPMAIFQDIANEKNFFRFIVTYNDIKMPTILLMNDEDRDGREIRRILPFSEEDDEFIEIHEGDRFSIEMQCITEPILEFYNGWANISMAQANPPSNIKGGALGFFSTYTSSTKEYIVTSDDL